MTQVNVKKAVLVAGKFGPDVVYLETDLPPTTNPYYGTTSLNFKVAKGKGKEYLEKNFPELPVEVINRN